MEHIDEFVQTFMPLLKLSVYGKDQYNRWGTFKFIATELLSKKRPVVIIETGTLNSINNWPGFGQSTLLWDWIIDKIGGQVTSVDIDLDKIKFGRAHCKHAKFVQADSIGFLRGTNADNVDLLYLDSYNWSPELHALSCLHHIGELAAIWERLPAGCLIAVDDAHSEFEGKHVMVKLFFDKILKIKPLSSSYIHLWRKP